MDVKELSGGRAADQAAAATKKERPEPAEKPEAPEQQAASVDFSSEGRAKAEAAASESQESADS